MGSSGSGALACLVACRSKQHIRHGRCMQGQCARLALCAQRLQRRRQRRAVRAPGLRRVQLAQQPDQAALRLAQTALQLARRVLQLRVLIRHTYGIINPSVSPVPTMPGDERSRCWDIKHQKRVVFCGKFRGSEHAGRQGAAPAWTPAASRCARWPWRRPAPAPGTPARKINVIANSTLQAQAATMQASSVHHLSIAGCCLTVCKRAYSVHV